MDREGPYKAYRNSQIPSAVEAEWLAEITDRKLRELAQGDWWPISFLESHGDFRHLELILQAKPRGLLDGCIFLEQTLSYAKAGRRKHGQVLFAKAIAHIRVRVEELLHKARSEALRARIQSLLDNVEKLK